MDIETLAHTDSLEQLAACEEYSRFQLEQEALTRFRMELEFGEVDDAFTEQDSESWVLWK